MQERLTKIIIACGGTGGHLFPGIAIAEELLKTNPDISVVFVGTERGLESKILPKMGWPLLAVGSKSIKDRKFIGKIIAYLTLPFSIISAGRLIKRERPNCVIGIGGYAAGPLVLAAAFKKIPTAVVEPNAIAGFANRILGKFVDRVFTGFPEAADFFPNSKVLLTGNPVRSNILAIKEKGEKNNGAITIFCFGGSQGALAINRAVTDALPYLSGSHAKFRFIHQTGEKEDLDKIKKLYEKHNFEADVFTFQDSIWESYARSDLVICRSGATTVSEIAVLGLPAIFVPYPFAADDHQRANAESLERRDAAVIIFQHELTGQKLAQEIKKMTRERLSAMSAAAARAGKPDAAKKIVEDCLKLISSSNQLPAVGRNNCLC